LIEAASLDLVETRKKEIAGASKIQPDTELIYELFYMRIYVGF
jgi:hypothetical protein